MRTIVFAYHDMGCTGIRALLAQGFEITTIFTHPDTASETLFFGSVARLAAEYNIPLHSPEDINHPLWVEHIRQLAPEVIFSFYYRQLLGNEILSLATAGAFNLHGSLLPRYRGRAPLNWVLINGEQQTGVTLHYMVAAADAGDIVGQEVVAISPDDDALSLHRKLLSHAEKLLADTLPAIRQRCAPRRPQDETQATVVTRRTPEQGRIDWQRPAIEIHNLIRALNAPWPGAFSDSHGSRFIIWRSAYDTTVHHSKAGKVLSVDPLRIACGEGCLEILSGQAENGVYLRGPALAHQLGLTEGTLLTDSSLHRAAKPTRVLILGVNGFIGNHLTERLLREDHYEVYGMDISSDAIRGFINHPRFHFVEGDISIHSEWIDYHIRKCDLVLPLVAIATPIEYTRNPLRVFELDFEENLKIIRGCVRHKKRIIFPSTSEVYGMCTDATFDEDHSNLVVGPINKPRWIYSVSKQLLDRVIWAYGEKEGLRFTLFRPFNWMGPRLDSLDSARIGSSRAITQLILNLVEGTPIQLVDGGQQKRCFTDISEGIEALFRIIENKEQRCDGQIINIGNPANEASIAALAEMLCHCFEKHPLRNQFPPFAGYRAVPGSSYYGKGYQDVTHRKPDIRNAQRLLGWHPAIPVAQTVEQTLDFFLRDLIATQQDH